jgi:exosortase A
MPLEAALPRPVAWAARVPVIWRTPLLHLALAWLGLGALFFADWSAMARQWWDSSTYNHILLVPFILAWLVRLRWGEVARVVPQAWWPGLIALAGALFVWLLGKLSGLNLASQLGAVASLQAAALTLLGPRVAAALLFPLAYMLFLVPIGDEFVPALQMITARMTIDLTLASGVPAVVDGVFIDTPAGLFEVAEECSGVKFLIAMIALGTLVAHVCFRSWKRRVLFMAAAVVLPILANGVRAWGTIFIAQSQGIEFAAGFDHIFYGWIFFALVIGALLAASWRYFDRWSEDTFVDVERLRRSPLLARVSRWSMPAWGAIAAICVLALATVWWSGAAQRLEAEMPASVALPRTPGWQPVDYRPTVWWEPRAGGAAHRLLVRLRDGEGREVDVFYALYAAQGDGREAGAMGEGALVPETAWRWLAPGRATAGGKSDRLQAEGRVRRVAVTWYRTGNVLTGRNWRLKLANMADRLTMRANPTAMLILSAEDRAGQPGQEAVEAFLAAAGPPDAWMDRIGQLP